MMNAEPAAERFLSYSAPEGWLIWKIMFLGNGNLVGELHRPGEAAASYVVLSAENGAQVMSDGIPGRDVSSTEGACSGPTGLFTTGEHLFYMHGYSGEGPEHLGIWAVDPMKAHAVWQRPDLSLVCNLGQSLLAYKAGSFAGFPERYYYLLDPVSGEVLDTLGDDVQRVNALRAAAPIEETRQAIELPVIYPQSVDGDLPDEAAGVLERLGRSGLCEYIVHDNLLAAALHRPDADAPSPAFTTDIALWHSGRQIFSDRICEGNPAPCMNYFLLKGVSLYYMVQRKELAAIRFNDATKGV